MSAPVNQRMSDSVCCCVIHCTTFIHFKSAVFIVRMRQKQFIEGRVKCLPWLTLNIVTQGNMPTVNFENLGFIHCKFLPTFFISHNGIRKFPIFLFEVVIHAHVHSSNCSKLGYVNWAPGFRNMWFVCKMSEPAPYISTWTSDTNYRTRTRHLLIAY